jgi:hypothetical protein
MLLHLLLILPAIYRLKSYSNSNFAVEMKCRREIERLRDWDRDRDRKRLRNTRLISISSCKQGQRGKRKEKENGMKWNEKV